MSSHSAKKDIDTQGVGKLDCSVHFARMSDDFLRDLMHAEHPAGQSKKRKEDGSKKTLDCDCSAPHADALAFDTQGCLKCPKTDCAYYVKNYVETFLFCNNVDIYHVGRRSKIMLPVFTRHMSSFACFH